jgi:uncharacterized coiled-coil protein SlyX
MQVLQAQDNANPNPQDAAIAKMRQMLRDAMGQAQDAQNQVVTLQAQVTQDEADKKALQDKLDALTAQLKSVSDQASADKADSTKQITDLKAQVDDQTGQISRLNDGIAKWKVAYDSTAQLAATNEAARKQYALQAALLKRTVDDREVKNLALYKLANEILTRYEQFGFGEALAAKEPFTGLARVKLENLVQDYKNKILDQAITSGQAPAASLQAVPPGAPSPKPAAPAPGNSAPPAVPVEPRTASARTTNAP